jgi:GTPase involved in cell partitioning and DNA repair
VQSAPHWGHARIDIGFDKNGGTPVEALSQPTNGFASDISKLRPPNDVLMFVVDAAGSEGRDPISDLEILRKEVSLHSPELAKRPWCIVANKIDLAESDEYMIHLKERFKRIKILPISANEGTGIDALRKYLESKISKPEV